MEKEDGSSPLVSDAVHAPLRVGLLGSLALAFLAGFLGSSLKTVALSYLAGLLLTFLTVIPDWAFFVRPLTEWTFTIPVDAESRARQLARSAEMYRGSSIKYAKREDIHPFRIMGFYVCLTCSLYFVWAFISS